MKFLLTKDELDGLVSVIEVERRDRALAAARTVVLTAAGEVCIHDDPPTGGRRFDRYCDDCPIHTKFERNASRMVCTLTRNYSK